LVALREARVALVHGRVDSRAIGAGTAAAMIDAFIIIKAS